MNAPQKILRTLVIFLGGVIVGLGVFRWYLINQAKNPPVSVEMPENRVQWDTPFTERSGKKIRSSDLLGSYWLANFVFTRCMGPCPLLSSHMAKLQNEFKGRSDLKFVSFTVDPEYDTPQVLTTYAKNFGADKDRWYFLSGPKDELYTLIRDGFRLGVGPDEKDPIQVVHSLSFVLVDKTGKVAGYFNINEPDKLTALREHLKGLP